MLGLTKKVPEYPFPILVDLMIVSAEHRDGTVGQKSPEWVKTLKPELIKSDRIKVFGAANSLAQGREGAFFQFQGASPRSPELPRSRVQ